MPETHGPFQPLVSHRIFRRTVRCKSFPSPMCCHSFCEAGWKPPSENFLLHTGHVASLDPSLEDTHRHLNLKIFASNPSIVAFNAPIVAFASANAVSLSSSFALSSDICETISLGPWNKTEFRHSRRVSTGIDVPSGLLDVSPMTTASNTDAQHAARPAARWGIGKGVTSISKSSLVLGRFSCSRTGHLTVTPPVSPPQS